MVLRQSALQTQHDNFQGQIKQTSETLEKLITAGICSPQEAATLRAQQIAHDEQIGSHNKRLGEIEILLAQDATARTSQAELIAKIETLQREARPWIELNALIGSASGDKFSKFAQGLTLAQLLALANQHLRELNDRYTIQRTTESELSLQIIDRYQADTIRPTRSLSVSVRPSSSDNSIDNYPNRSISTRFYRFGSSSIELLSNWMEGANRDHPDCSSWAIGAVDRSYSRGGRSRVARMRR